MYHSVFATATIDALEPLLEEDGGTALCTQVEHDLIEAFGGSAFAFAVGIDMDELIITFTSTEPLRYLVDALGGFQTIFEDVDITLDTIDVD